MVDALCQKQAQPLAKKTASLIERETDEHRTSNVQHRTSNECILSILRMTERADFAIVAEGYDG